MTATDNLHGTCIDIAGRGVLLRGAPGAGKSDLALRLIDGGARLVADDRVVLARDGDGLLARAPDALAGRLEVRGIGIVCLKPEHVAPSVPLTLIADLVAPAAVERLPDARRETLLGVSLPVIALDPFAASAPAKLRLAVGAGPGSIMTAP